MQTTSGSLLGFLRWWRDELRDLVPASMRTETGSKVILAPGPAGYRLLESTGGKVNLAGDDLSVLDAVTAAGQLAKRTPGAEVGIRVPLETCFVRHVDLPRTAQSDAARILDLDLERATPFKLKDVYTAALVDDGDGRSARVRVRHMMIKREAVEPVRGELEASGVPVDFIDCWSEREEQALPVNFLATQRAAAAGTGRSMSLTSWLIIAVGLLAITGVMLAESRYQTALATVQDEVAQARGKATSVRRALDTSEAALTEINRLQGLKLATPPAVEVIDALTKLLPDTVWLNELRFGDGHIDISGLAKSGASLIPLFSNSPLFADATLASGVNFDPQENKERFTLRVRVRPPAGTAQAASTGQEKR